MPDLRRRQRVASSGKAGEGIAALVVAVTERPPRSASPESVTRARRAGAPLPATTMVPVMLDVPAGVSSAGGSRAGRRALAATAAAARRRLAAALGAGLRRRRSRRSEDRERRKRAKTLAWSPVRGPREMTRTAKRSKGWFVSARYPTRSATIGSTDAARRAGTRHARSGDRTSTIDTARNVSPSVGSTPNSSVVSTRVRTSAPPKPIARPTSDQLQPLAQHHAQHVGRARAPSAMRMPNSCVRWLTEKATTPAMPAAVITSASSAEQAEQRRGQARRGERRGADLGQRAEIVDRLVRIDRVNGGRGSAAPWSADRRRCEPARSSTAGRSGTSARRARRAPAPSAAAGCRRRRRRWSTSAGRRRRRSRCRPGSWSGPVVPRHASG